MEELEAGLERIRRSPSGTGSVELLVVRPAENARETPAVVMLDPVEGVVGDTWRNRGSSRTAGGSADPEAQVTIMNARAAALVSDAGPERWQLAGDQIYADFDLSLTNLPPGTRLRVGSAVLEVSAKAHTGCAKFVARFGEDAMRFVNSPPGRALRLRGVNCRVLAPGLVRLGDAISKEADLADEPAPPAAARPETTARTSPGS